MQESPEKPGAKLVDAFDATPKDPMLDKLVADRYHVEELIGTGGWGRVYRVTHSGLNQSMALKLLHSSHVLDREKLARFKQEAEAVSALDHPNICRVIDFAEGPEGQPCMVMELLVGKRLDEAIKEKQKLDLPETLRVGVQLCAALSAAHRKGIVHRDLKPANVMLVAQDGEDGATKVKVMDFGLAKIMDESAEASRSLTETGLTIGTPAYMSPEQCLGQRVDARTDIYAIGCILYEAMSGKKAFDGNSFLEIMNAHLQKTPKTFTQPTSPEAERTLEAMLMKAMEHDREARYQTVDELLEDLTKLQQQQKVFITKPKRKRQQGVSAKRILIGTAFGVMLLGGTALWSVWNREQQPAPAPNMLQQDHELKPHRPESYEGKTLADLTRAIEEDPNNPEHYLDRGYLHDIRDERDSAIEDYSQAIKLDPLNAKAYDRRAEMYVMIQKLDEALADATAEIKVSPGRYHGWAERARVNMALEKYGDAVSDAKHSLQIEFNVPASDTLATTYEALGDFGGAFRCMQLNIQRGNSTNDERYWNHYGLGILFLRARAFDKSIENFNTALSNHHLMSQAWGDMASAYASRNDFKNAERAIKNTLSLDSFPARAYRLKGEMYRAGGKWAEAIQEYSTSTSLEPWFGPGFEQRAYAEIAMGQMTSALTDLERAAKSMPHSGRIFSALAMVEDQLGRTDAAEKHMKAAFEQTPVVPEAFVNRARISMRKGDYVAAVNDLNRALEQNPRFADAYASRAIALAKLNRNGDADQDKKYADGLWYHAPDVALKVAPAGSIVGGATVSVSHPSIDVAPRKDAVPSEMMTNEQLVALGASSIWINMYMQTGKIGSDKMLDMWNTSKSNKEWAHQMCVNFDAHGKETLYEALSKLATPTADKSRAALDHVRFIALCRFGYIAGYLTEKEAWDAILPVSRSIQKQFDSWQDLGQHYADGRAKYLGVDDGEQFNAILKEYMSDPDTPPNTVPFKN